MLIEILDPTMDGTFKIINPKGESVGVICFDIQYQVPGCNDLVTMTVNFETYMNALGEDIR